MPNHLLVLDLAHRQWPIPVELRSSVHLLVGAGAQERAGRRVIPSRRLGLRTKLVCYFAFGRIE